MVVKKAVALLASLALAAVLAGCGSQGSSADPPIDFQVTAGDASVTVTWTADPEVDYWIFFRAGDSISTSNWATTGGRVVTKAVSPQVVTGLTNGTTYAFTINGRKNGGPGGEGSPSRTAVPRLSGTVWTAGTPLGTGRLTGLAAGLTAGGYTTAVVGTGGAIYSSVANAAIAPVTNPAAPADLNAAWYATTALVAVGANGTIITSNDGTTWTSRTSGTTANLYGGTSTGITGHMAVGAAGTIVSSSDGNDWAPLVSNIASDLYAVAYGNGRYVAVGAAGTMVTSTDGGATWTAITPVTSADLRGITFGTWTTTVDGTTVATLRFVAVGANGTVLTSDDGATWTVQAAVTANRLNAVTYGGQFVAAGAGGTILTSTDGITWTTRTSGTTKDLNAVLRNLTGYAVVGADGTYLLSS